MLSGQPCEKEGTFRYQNSCTLHYQCSYNTKCGKIIPSKLYECPGCLKFNANIMACDIPKNVAECTFHDEELSEINDYTVTDPVNYCTGPGIFLDPANRERYFECIDIHGKDKYYLTIRTCPENTTFNDLNKVCDSEHSSDLPSEKDIPGICNAHNYAVDPYRCHKFYFCRDGVPFVQLSCLKTHFFNGRFCQHKDRSMLCRWSDLKTSFTTK